MEGVKGHGIEGVREQGEHRDVLQSLNDVHQAQQPKQGEPSGGDSPFKRLAQSDCGEAGHGQERSVVDQQRSPALPAVLRKDGLLKQPRGDHDERNGETDGDENRCEVRYFSGPSALGFVLQVDAVKDVAQQQKGEVDGSRGMDQRHAPQRQANANGVVALALVGRSEQRQHPNDHAELTGDAGVAGIEGLRKQAEAQPHRQHGLPACAVAVEGPHQADEHGEEGPMPQTVHGNTRIEVERCCQPSREGRIGWRVGPKPDVGPGKDEFSLKHNLLGEHGKSNPINPKRKRLEGWTQEGGEGDHNADPQQGEVSFALKLELRFGFFAERGVGGAVSDFAVHGGFKPLPVASLSHHLVAYRYRSVGEEIQADHRHPHQADRPDAQQQQGAAHAVEQQQSQGGSEKPLS